MSLLHTELRVVFLARDVLQQHAWQHQEDNPEDFHNDEAWQAMQDAVDAINDCIQVVGGELS